MNIATHLLKQVIRKKDAGNYVLAMCLLHCYGNANKSFQLVALHVAQDPKNNKCFCK